MTIFGDIKGVNCNISFDNCVILKVLICSKLSVLLGVSKTVSSLSFSDKFIMLSTYIHVAEYNVRLEVAEYKFIILCSFTMR